MTERLHFHFSLSCTGEGNGIPLQCSCLRIPGTGEPGGLLSMGSHRVGHDWSDLAAAAAARLVKFYSSKSISPHMSVHVHVSAVTSAVSGSLQHYRLQRTRLLCPWDSPGKNTGVGCHFLLQGTFPTQGSNPSLLGLLHWQVGSLPLAPPEKPLTCPQVTSWAHRKRSRDQWVMSATGLEEECHRRCPTRPFTNVYCKDTKDSSIHRKEYLQQGLSYDSSYPFYTYFPPSLPCSVPRKAEPVDCFLHTSLLSGFWLRSIRTPWLIRVKRGESCRHFFPASSLLWCQIQTSIYKIDRQGEYTV